MNGDIRALADDFQPASAADWMRLVDRTLKGGSFEQLRTPTADGAVMEPLYPQAEQAAGGRAAPAGDPERPWDIRTIVDHPDPARANAHALADLNGGAASLLLTLDAWGETGVAVRGREDLARVLDGVLLDLAPVALDLAPSWGWMGPAAADWLADLAKGGPAAPLRFHMDPLGTWARTGVTPGPVEGHLTLAAETGARHAGTYPKAGLFLASGRAVHEAGGSEGWELGVAAAAAIAYARALTQAGVSAEDAWGRITLGLSADVEHLTTVAKLRAARVIWAKLTAACGEAKPLRIEARSSRRMLAKQDVWTNLLRLTVAGFGAALGGADAVVLEAFTAPLHGLGARASALGRRQARNTQLVLMEEAGLGRVADPAGGSGWIEARTDGLARAGWAAMREIEAAGGLVEALRSGLIAARVKAARSVRLADYAADRQGLIGVTRFLNTHDEPPTLERVETAGGNRPDVSQSGRLPGADSVCPALTPIRWAEPFEGGHDGR